VFETASEENRSLLWISSMFNPPPEGRFWGDLGKSSHGRSGTFRWVTASKPGENSEK
jgi:hypothetical protein